MRLVKPLSHTDICIVLFLATALCKYFLPGYLTKLLPIVAMGIAFLLIRQIKEIVLNKQDFFFSIFFVGWLFGCFYSVDLFKGLGYVMSFFMAYSMIILLRKKSINESLVISEISIFCFIFSFFLFIQPFFPDIVSKITRHFSYPGNNNELIEAWINNSWYMGLFPERAPAAFYSCILIGTGLYCVLKSKYLQNFRLQICGWIMMTTGLYCVILTAKRGLLLGSGVALIISYIINQKSRNIPIGKVFIVIFLIIIIVIAILLNLDAFKILLIRFIEVDDITTGRTNIYFKMLSSILKNPLIGTGTASAFKMLGIGGHNIYLTVLFENGIVAFTFLIIAILYTLYKTIINAFFIGRHIGHSKLPFFIFGLYIQILFFIYGFFGNPLYDNYILYFYLFSLLINSNMIYNFKRKTLNESLYTNISFRK